MERLRPLTMDDLRSERTAIESIATRRGAKNIRVFGSVARGQARPTSNVDFLVDLDPERSVLDVSELILDLEELLGHPVHVVENRHSSPVATRIHAQSVPLC